MPWAELNPLPNVSDVVYFSAAGVSGHQVDKKTHLCTRGVQETLEEASVPGNHLVPQADHILGEISLHKVYTGAPGYSIYQLHKCIPSLEI